MPISPEKQLERRKIILAKTREMINDHGIEAVNIRELAKFCGVSVPTLYNQFGNKDNLVFAAVEELFRLHFERLGSLPNKKRGLEQILFLNDYTAKVIYSYSENSKLYAIRMPRGNNSLMSAHALYRDAVGQMQDDGELVEWVDSDFAAQRLYRQIRSVTVDWSKEFITFEQMLRLREIEIFLLLLSLSTEKSRQALEKHLKKAMAELNKLRV